MQTRSNKNDAHPQSKAAAIDRSSKPFAQQAAFQLVASSTKADKKIGLADKGNYLSIGQTPPPPPSSHSNETMQMQIGRGGAANVGKLVEAADHTIAKITSGAAAEYMPSVTPWPEDPITYGLNFYNGNSGYALDNDENYDLMDAKVTEGSLTTEQKIRRGWLIPMRSKLLQSKEAGTPHTKDGQYPFVITADGKLLIGSDSTSGHTGFAAGKAVRMAGEMTISGGKYKYKEKRSGHYMPSEHEEARGLEFMKQKFPEIEIVPPEKKSFQQLFLEDQALSSSSISFMSAPPKRRQNRAPESKEIPSVLSSNSNLAQAPSLSSSSSFYPVLSPEQEVWLESIKHLLPSFDAKDFDFLSPLALPTPLVSSHDGKSDLMAPSMMASSQDLKLDLPAPSVMGSSREVKRVPAPVHPLLGSSISAPAPAPAPHVREDLSDFIPMAYEEDAPREHRVHVRGPDIELQDL